MDRSRGLSAVAVTVILGVTLVSGPAVGLVDLTQPRFDPGNIGQGNATVSEVRTPATVQLKQGLETESYYLETPDATIRVTAIQGRPTVAYKLAIPSMGYSRGTTHFLGPDDTGWVSLSLARDTLPGDRVSASSYEGTLSVTLRYNGTERVLSERPVTVEVVE